MSGVYSSTQHSAPGSPAVSTPSARPGCRIPNGAPARSASTALRPDSGPSAGPTSTLPCACSAASAVARTSSLRKYTVQPGGPCPQAARAPPATAFPASRKTP